MIDWHRIKCTCGHALGFHNVNAPNVCLMLHCSCIGYEATNDSIGSRATHWAFAAILFVAGVILLSYSMFPSSPPPLDDRAKRTAAACYDMGVNAGRMQAAMESAHVALTPAEQASLRPPGYCGP